MTSFPAMLPDWVRAANPPSASATPAAKITWLRKFARLVANDMALAELYGLEAPSEFSGGAETLLLCLGMAERIGATRDQGIVAARAEWTAAKERARLYAEDLRRGVKSLAYERAAGGEIVARAETINRRHYWQDRIDLTRSDLIEITKKIAMATAPVGKSHGR